MVIDSHAHLGICRVFGSNVTEEHLIRTMDKYGVDTSLVMPLPGTPNAKVTHDQINELTKKYPGRIVGMISINPHIDEAEYFEEVERCVKMGFVALKLHPFGHACPVVAPDADKVFEAARKFKIPVILHSGLGAPYTTPCAFIPRARQYPDLKIVVAHSGAYIYTNEAFVIAQECPNVYLETSWCAPHRIYELVAKFPGRVMFGSDIPEAVASELMKYRSGDLSEEALEEALGGTAKKVFNLQNR